MADACVCHDSVNCDFLQVDLALGLFPEHADSLELKKQLRNRLNAIY